jgi:transcriptional regulator with XRE-family HTH domain
MKRNWLAKCRADVGLTQQEIANKCNIGRAYYTQIELGVRTPSPTVAKKIAIKLSFDWIIFFGTKCSVMEHDDNPPHMCHTG